MSLKSLYAMRNTEMVTKIYIYEIMFTINSMTSKHIESLQCQFRSSDKNRNEVMKDINITTTPKNKFHMKYFY